MKTNAPPHLGRLALPLVLAYAGCPGGPSPVAVQRLVLTPAQASVPVGGTVRFAAALRAPDGTVAAVPVSFVATGGTISDRGVFSAGRSPGTYRVMAARTGGPALADTAAVTVAPAGAHTYTTTFPLTENPISENGHWINGGTVGLDWTNVSTTPGLAIGHQVGASFTDATALLTGRWGPDQAAAAAVRAVSQNDDCYQEVELRLRSAMAPHRNRGYEISFKSSQSPQAYLIVVRWNGALGDFTYLFHQQGAQFGLKDGDVVRATMVGNVIRAYKNGLQMAQVTDDTYTEGSPGLGFNLLSRPPGCAGTNGDYGYSSYTATDFVASNLAPASSPR